MGGGLDLRRIGMYLVFAFGIAWATALVIYLTGGLSGSRALVPGTPITAVSAGCSVAALWSSTAGKGGCRRYDQSSIL